MIKDKEKMFSLSFRRYFASGDMFMSHDSIFCQASSSIDQPGVVSAVFPVSFKCCNNVVLKIIPSDSDLSIGTLQSARLFR